jgi:hypothetical protein
MPETQYGVGQNFGLSGALIEVAASGTALVATNIRYYALLNLQNVRVVTNGEWEEVANKAGDIASIIIHGDYLEMEVEAIPQGASLQAAAIGARIYPRGTQFHAVNFGHAQIPIGPFTVSGINSMTGNTPPGAVTAAGVSDIEPWRLFSSTLNTTNTGKWSLDMTLRRYKGMLYGAQIPAA